MSEFAETPSTIPTIVQHLESRIRQRAQELYEERGREEGHAWDDWLRAEKEILSGQTLAAAA